MYLNVFILTPSRSPSPPGKIESPLVAKLAVADGWARLAQCGLSLSAHRTDNMELLLVLEWLPPRRSIPGTPLASLHPGKGRPLCPIPHGRICTTLLWSNLISKNFLSV